MSTVLVVDDSPIERAAAAKLLRSLENVSVELCDCGASALSRLRSGGIDLVLTDVQMPEMDGLELLAAIRESEPAIPVVIMTSRGSEELAVAALKAGAASYVPKSLLQRDLASTVASVLEAAQRDRNQRRLWSCLTEQRIAFELPNDSSYVPHAVACVQETLHRFQLCDERDRIRIGVAVEEALTNAIIHGNLEVGSELRERLDDAFGQLIEQRKNESPYRERRVFVQIVASHREASIVIGDEGPGFDVSRLPDPTDPENLGKCSGRGILLMRTFLDEVVFNAAGNQVTMVKRAKPAGMPTHFHSRPSGRKMATATT